MAQIIPYVEQQEPPPRFFEMTVVAQDPSVTGPDGKILRTVIRVPATRLQPGPTGDRFAVVDYDVSRRLLRPAADLAKGPSHYPGWGFEDQLAEASDHAILTDPAIHAQNVYAIAARTLAQFEFALGRPVPWSFGGHHLSLVPHAFAEANAYYSDADQALYFGYFPGRKQNETVYTCLSHDIVAHETTHAVLDGLRSRFIAPGLPDQAAFHEGFADVVALLSIFSAQEVVAQLLGGSGGQRLTRADVDPDRLKRTSLVKLAEQMGDALYAQRGNGLRRSVGLQPTLAWKDPDNHAWEEPHRRGEILVAAVMQALLLMWRSRLEALIQADVLDRDRAAEEGSVAAQHLLQMMIRAIDYTPPVEFEFADFLTAALVSDEEVSPDDRHGYRPALKDAFGRFGIEEDRGDAVDLSKVMNRPVYRDFNAGALRSAPDEVARFIWQNAKFLDIDPRFYLNVEEVWPSVRIGPNGFVIVETVVDYIQEVEGTPQDLIRMSKSHLQIPQGVPDDTKIRLWGGGTLIFDQFGGVKYHQTKPLGDWERQSRRLRYLVRNGLFDSRKGLGASLGTPVGQRFALYHQPDSTAGEDW
jgi:hypothetical protein